MLRTLFRRCLRYPTQTKFERKLCAEQLELRVMLDASASFVGAQMAGEIQYRVNSGGPQLAGTPEWSADAGASPSAFVNALGGNSFTATTALPIDVSHPSIPTGTPDAVFASERYDLGGGTEMQWNFPVAPGDYEVRLYFAEIFEFGQSVGFRKFDVQIEGVTVLDDYDVFADVGGFAGVVKTYQVTSDANIDIDFLHVNENPALKGIEIVSAGEVDELLTVSASQLDFGNVAANSTADQVLTLTNSSPIGGSDVTIDPATTAIVPTVQPFIFQFAQSIPIVLSPGEMTDVTVTFAPLVPGGAAAALSIPHSGVNSPINIGLTGQGQSVTTGEVIYRVNAGGTNIVSTPDWDVDTAANPSTYLNTQGGNSATFTTTDPVSMTHPSIPAGTPTAVLQSERYDLPGNTEMTWDFAVTPGEYEVRLYFAETFIFGQSTGFREFDVQIEGNTVLDGYDVYEDVGGFTGVMKSFPVVSDANLDIDLLRVKENPAIKGIEILSGGAVDELLIPSSSGLDFGTVAVNDSAVQLLTLTNNGPSGSNDVIIDPAAAFISPAEQPFTFQFAQATPIALAPGASTDVTVTYAPLGSGAANATLSVPHSGVNSPLNISLAGQAQVVAAGQVFYRVNVGSNGIAGNPNWEPDTDVFPSTYLSPQSLNTFTSTTGNAVDVSHPSIPIGTPAELFRSERYDFPGSGEMAWDFPVTPGEYEVRLYFSEIFEFGQSVGFRTFDVEIEGATVLTNYDVFADVGGFAGVMKSFTVVSDTNLDIDLLHVTENPALKGIEILAAENLPLQPSTTSLDFGSLTNGLTSQLSVVLTNNNTGDIVIDPASATIQPFGSPFSVAFAQSTPITVSPGGSTTAIITFSPVQAVPSSATLSIVHSAANSPIDITLDGIGVDTGTVNFNKSVLSTLEGLINPTSLQFGADDRLYVAEQGGTIHALTIVRNGPNDFQVVNQEKIFLIRDMPNHSDDGALEPSQSGRLVTGFVTAGTSQNPILYVSSSDPRIGAGPDGFDLNLDTNSGIISRLTWNGTSWEKLDLVRGLPRSEENHGPNGMQLDASGTVMYLAIGGNTNAGAPRTTLPCCRNMRSRLRSCRSIWRRLARRPMTCPR